VRKRGGQEHDRQAHGQAAARLNDARTNALALLQSPRSAIAQRGSLSHTAHRPWPVPTRRWLVGQSWHDLLFAHWCVPRSALRRVVPPDLELDTFDGECWLGVVPFQMRTVRFAWCPPVAGTSSFAEINLRTYVVSGGRPGVFFLTLDAANTIAVSLGRRLYGLPYLHARVALQRQGDAIAFHSSRDEPGWPAASFAATYRPTGLARQALPGTLEHWLTERYCFYTTRRGRLSRTEIHHEPWPLQPAAAEIQSNTLAESHDIELAGAPLLHFSRSQHVVAWAPENPPGAR
jgi:uncharacterized protein YqjF (DUF2071 family)